MYKLGMVIRWLIGIGIWATIFYMIYHHTENL